MSKQKIVGSWHSLAWRPFHMASGALFALIRMTQQKPYPRALVSESLEGKGKLLRADQQAVGRVGRSRASTQGRLRQQPPTEALYS